MARGRVESRLLAVDALRGIAALAVVLFHYTTRFTQLYPQDSAPSVSFPLGYLGVNLFFIISGFVIFMTLEKTRRPMDFVVSRFSRLFPTYWAAVAITFATVSVFGLPGKEVSLLQAVGNLLMIHGFLRIPHVDGVYWTLEVEMLFYVWMLLLYSLGWMSRIYWALWMLLTLRLVYHLAFAWGGIELSWTVSRILILPYIAWFSLGISVYRLLRPDGSAAGLAWGTAVAAVLCIAIVEGPMLGVLAVGLAWAVWVAAAGRVAALNHPVVVFLGTISYPLYLIHENVGWVIQRGLLAAGWTFDFAALATLGLILVVAWMLSTAVEKPALAAIRGLYKRRCETSRR
ncbi:MAG: hypothetical protein LKCHEGNO_00083 [Burkholderiaceae bacterium]|nr:hypothetical protein [Burkholderiaceae bacterium]